MSLIAITLPEPIFRIVGEHVQHRPREPTFTLIGFSVESLTAVGHQVPIDFRIVAGFDSVLVGLARIIAVIMVLVVLGAVAGVVDLGRLLELARMGSGFLVVSP